jgi:hypothetical protein
MEFLGQQLRVLSRNPFAQVTDQTATEAHKAITASSLPTMPYTIAAAIEPSTIFVNSITAV